MNEDSAGRAEIAVDDTWALAKGELQGGQPRLIRVRSGLRPLAGHAAFPKRLTVEWRYPAEGPEGAYGLPAPRQQAELEAFEDALVAALEGPPRAAVLTSVHTAQGQRAWVWYAGADAGPLEARINAALAGRPPLPITLAADHDPGWHHYVALLDALGL